jgi:hypothetical protein
MEELDKVSREERDDFRKHYEQIHQAFYIRDTNRKPADHRFLESSIIISIKLVQRVSP